MSDWKQLKDCCCGKGFLVTGAAGSPLTGVGGGECVCPICGRTLYIVTGHNHLRFRELNEWLDKENAAETVAGMPLYNVVQDIMTMEKLMQ